MRLAQVWSAGSFSRHLVSPWENTPEFSRLARAERIIFLSEIGSCGSAQRWQARIWFQISSSGCVGDHSLAVHGIFVFLEIITGDRAVSGIQVDEDAKRSDIGVSYHVIFEGFDVRFGDGSDELLFECCFDACKQNKLIEACLLVCAICLRS